MMRERGRQLSHGRIVVILSAIIVVSAFSIAMSWLVESSSTGAIAILTLPFILLAVVTLLLLIYAIVTFSRGWRR